eukprot:gnl/Spiro4/22994_TR11357_c0_g2_i1.p1 gnl/Spiro4/22994_TR11357_c0_g2~~gnl/Spiro4/22994_TR11357_c0_g2_i1.p1  ORF type:complete len:228 (-),score=46.26 gnl/Spiro4/22994_TR11357_c0_g2_i1:110-793(-)
MLRSVVVWGGAGQLGRVVVSHFNASNRWRTISVDLLQNDEAAANIIVPKAGPVESNALYLINALRELASPDSRAGIDAAVCVAGGWAGGNIASSTVLQDFEGQLSCNLRPALMCAHVASQVLNEDGLLVLTGAQTVYKGGTPGMIPYGLVKSATHHLIASLALPQSGLPARTTVVGILPTTLDTEMNRKWMPKEDFSRWTPLVQVAGTVLKWADGRERPQNGAMIPV